MLLKIKKETMKSLKLFAALLIAHAFCLCIPATSFCQTQKLDIVQFTPPRGWAKTTKDDAVIFVDADKNANTFCVLTIHSSTASAGNVEKDFAAEWKNFVVTPHAADDNPKTETEIKDGWTITSANTQIETDGVKSVAVLIVYSGFGKTTSILAILNSQTYLKPLTEFLETVKIDKASVVTQVRAPATNSSAPSLVGRWGTGTAADTVSGNYVTYGSNATQKYYQFNADGTFSFIYSGYSGLAGQVGSFHITTQESGVYTLNGDSITITPRKSQTNSNSGGLRNNPLETVTYRWTIHYFEGIQSYSLILHPDHQTNRDGGFDYVLAFPNSYSYSQIK
jgi:hypothetical protein